MLDDMSAAVCALCVCVCVCDIQNGVLDENHLVCLDEWSHADDVLGCNPEEVAFPVNESLNHSVVPCDRVGTPRSSPCGRTPSSR